MKKDTNLLDTQDVRAEAATALTPNATNGEKIKALRTAQGMSMAELSRRASIRFCEELLGFYTVLLNCEYIGINPNCSKQQRRSALAHELGHAIFDRKHAASGQAFQDTYFYSLSNAKAERRANTFAAELLLSDDDVLKPIGFYEFNADRLQMACKDISEL